MYLGARSAAVVPGFHLDQIPDTLDVALDVSQSTQAEWQPDGPCCLLSNPARTILVCQVPTGTLPGLRAEDEVKGLEMGLVGQGGVAELEREVGLVGEVTVTVVVVVGMEVDAAESLGWGVTVIGEGAVAVKAAEAAEVFQEVGLTMIAELGYWAIGNEGDYRQPAADVLQAVHAAYILQCLSIQ
jgi:hypothetical protein